MCGETNIQSSDIQTKLNYYKLTFDTQHHTAKFLSM